MMLQSISQWITKWITKWIKTKTIKKINPINPIINIIFLMALGAGQALAMAWPWNMGWITRGETMPLLQSITTAIIMACLWGSTTTKQAVFRMAWFSFGAALCSFWWLVVSMNTYGGMPLIIALLALACLAGLLAMLWALVAWVWYTIMQHCHLTWFYRTLVGSVLWGILTLGLEWLRGHALFGFAWGLLGYAHLDTLGGFAPWIGVYGVGSLVSIWAAAWGRWLWHIAHQKPWSVTQKHWLNRIYELKLIWLGGWGVGGLIMVLLSPQMLQWGHHALIPTGSLKVRLLQGNIGQDEKFIPGKGLQKALKWYPDQWRKAWQTSQAVDLVIAPETALPLLPQQLPPSWWYDVLNALAKADQPNPKALLTGIPLGNNDEGYTNSAWGITQQQAADVLAQHPLTQASFDTPEVWYQALESAPWYRYDKHHLVPFGEFIPKAFGWFVRLMNIPLGDFNRGALPQKPWLWGGQRVGVNICYEDVFGEELALAFADREHTPTLWVNLSNIAWFGDTVAIDQHLLMSRWRSLELGRSMVRATNTGATVVIAATGQVTHALPPYTQGFLDASVIGYEGRTPYAILVNWLNQKF